MNSQDFIRYQEMTFDAYCKRLVKNESRNALRGIIRREKHELPFSMLADAEVMRFSYEDSYDLESKEFSLTQDTVIVQDSEIADALVALPPSWRKIILLFYFKRQNDQQIGEELGSSANAAYYRRRRSILELRKAMENHQNEL